MDKVKVNMGSSMGGALLITIWVYGMVLAKGFWMMTLAIFVPVYSWYLAVEQIALKVGLGI